MKTKSSKLFLCVAGGLLFTSTHAAGPTKANLYELMKDVVAPQTQIVWDVGNEATDDEGNPDGSKLKPADWMRLAAAAGKVKQASLALAEAEHVMAAAPGQKIEGEGVAGSFGAKEVQQVIDANPKVFRAFAQQLAGTMDEVIASTQSKDAAKLFDVSGRLDQVCEACHVQFWYPNQDVPR